MVNRLLLFILFFSSLSVSAQVTIVDAAGPAQAVEILHSVTLQLKKLPDGTEVQVLAGNVRLKQGTVLFNADSVIVNQQTKTFEAFGRVHINDSDTANVRSNYLRYHTDRRYAFLRGNVRLTDGHGTLTTPDLEYDVANRMGYYKNGGRVVNQGTVLTSREGVYYAELKEILFRRNVELRDKSFYLRSDSLLYNTETQMAKFIADTYIRDSSGRVIRTTEGYYDLKTRNSVFTQRTSIEDGAVRIAGDQIASDEPSGIVQIRGRGVLIDTVQGIYIIANEIFANRKTEAYLATNKPLMIIRQEQDSIYITADTLFSARLSDLLIKTPDSASVASSRTNKAATAPKDSADRYFEAFRNVRIFSDSVQAVSDSIFYSFKDSIFQLYQNPIVWSKNSQISGDTIHLFTLNKKPDRLNVFDNSFMISQSSPGIYNQVKSSRMNGFFVNGSIDSIRARGLAESIYFIQDDDSAYSGINQTTSDLIDILFSGGQVRKVVFISDVKGTVWPMSLKEPNEMKLPGFIWLDERRPKTKYEMFQ